MRPSLEERVYRQNHRLYAVSMAASKAFGSGKVELPEPRALRDVIFRIRKVIRSVDGAQACFIGGLAVQELGYVRATEDVDLVVDTNHYGTVLHRLREAGFELTAQSYLCHRETGIKVDLLREGTKLRSSRFPLPHPSELGPNLGFATLPAVIRLKLEAGRMQDQADVVMLLKPRLKEIPKIAAQLPEALRGEYQRLAGIARREAGR